MTDYTPTTEEVQRAYRNSEYGGRDTEFDRWLAEVKADAWYLGAVTAINYALNGSPSLPENPYDNEPTP